MVSRSLGKIAIPSDNLLSEKHNNTFWVCEILEETGFGNKGIIVSKPLYPVESIALLPGMFTIEINNHWCFLSLKEGTPVKPYYVPQVIKKPYLQNGDISVVCIPYEEKDLKVLYSL